MIIYLVVLCTEVLSSLGAFFGWQNRIGFQADSFMELITTHNYYIQEVLPWKKYLLNLTKKQGDYYRPVIKKLVFDVCPVKKLSFFLESAIGNALQPTRRFLYQWRRKDHHSRGAGRSPAGGSDIDFQRHGDSQNHKGDRGIIRITIHSGSAQEYAADPFFYFTFRNVR